MILNMRFMQNNSMDLILKTRSILKKIALKIIFDLNILITRHIRKYFFPFPN